MIDKIVNIEEVGEYETIDIHVSGNNLFYANDILTHNSGYDVEVPKLDSIGESIGLAATADVIIGITQSDEDKELNITNIHMMKNRFGQNFGSNQMRIDFNTLTVREDESLNDDDNDLESTAAALNMLSN